MKKTLQRLGMVTVGLSLCLWSCDKQDVNVQPNEATASIVPKVKEKIDFYVVEGRLKFETVDDFKAALAKTSTLQEIEIWEQQAGFTSLDEAYKEFLSKNYEGLIPKEYDDVAKIIIDNDGGKSYEMGLTMPSLSVLVNRDGLVQVGEEVMKFSDENLKITDVKYIQELETNVKSSHVKVNKVIQGEIMLKNAKGERIKDYTWETYNWWHYPKPSGYADRRFQSRIYAKTVNAGQYYIWDVGVEIVHQRNDFWGWASCDIDGWRWGSGYVTLQPNGYGSLVTQSNIIPSGSTWSGGTWAGYANYRRNITGVVYPSTTVPQTKLGILVQFRPGNIIGTTFGDQNLNYLSFDAAI